MTSFYQRGKTWTANVSFYQDGLRKRKTKSGFALKKDAKKWASEIENTSLSATASSDRLLSDYFESWFKTYKADKANKTILQYQNTLNDIKKFMPAATLVDFTRKDFQTFLNKFGQNRSKETVAKRKVQIAGALRDAYADHLIKEDPTQRLNIFYTRPSKDPDLKFLEKASIIKILSETSKRLSLTNFLITTALLSGGRFSELRALIDSDIDPVKRTISINKSVDEITGQDKETKNKSSIRTISMPDSWWEQYRSYQHDGERLFEISNNAANKALRLLLQRLKIKQVTFHALRHSHASLLLADDISIQYVSERLGHANVAITESVYAHLLANKRLSEESKAMKKLNNL
ncbi:tyrosine-type recombinase/integrase [Oenococcus sicerae]|uniref:Tyrosine-type recombinase/integrase n=1 Tax=Oenococcus sicerae TaxID=2203724 RepID=A0ABX5QNI3_9LACO|nr:tyrosine-type recombinase/integrase [Oenococcus sicerae]QAS70227.1 tyrosine-type recombinase/integrase [Oenococcus sicerae]